MISFLITCKSKQKREQYALAYCQKNKIDPIDMLILDKFSTENSRPAFSIGIEDIKNLQGRLYLKPIKSAMKVCLIQDAQFLTIEAQNAMLKFLEEPPLNTLIILTASTKEIFLQTILSRCKTIELPETKLLTEGEKEELHQQIDELSSLTISDGLIKAESLAKNKDRTLNWLEEMVLVLREKILNAVAEGSREKTVQYAYYLKLFQKTHQTVKTTNINLRFTLENLLIALTINTQKTHPE